MATILTDGFDDMIGSGPHMQDVFRWITRMAPTDRPVLILGETGTGKELVARAIHRHSPRRERRFVDLNCAAVPTSLFESEVFGHEPGAFTDAKSRRIGCFEQADRGTLFFDEVGELSSEAQTKLLRVIERGEVTRLGGSRPVPVNVRIIAATNADLDAAMTRGVFRPDLYWRLNTLQIRLPPLRERPTDLPLLVEHYFARIKVAVGRPAVNLSVDAQDALLAHGWPGNVRELEHALEQAIVSASGSTIEATDLPLSIFEAPKGPQVPNLVRPKDVPLPEALRQFTDRLERRWILEALRECNGNRGAAARALGIDRRTLYSMAARLRLVAEATSPVERKSLQSRTTRVGSIDPNRSDPMISPQRRQR
jgi:two-component system, NtrC family, response regulator AtoC